MKEPDVCNPPKSLEVPDELNRMIDIVLAYRPKPKTKAAKKRKRKKTALDKIDKEKEKPS